MKNGSEACVPGRINENIRIDRYRSGFQEAGQPTLFLADSKDLRIHLSARLPVRVQLALDEEDKKPNGTSVKLLGIISR